jgi:hypothetical protein
MLRTFNYTKRKKIAKECVRLTLNKVGDDTHFNAVLKIADLELQPDAKVFIEAYYGPTSYRFDFGEFSQIKQPEHTNITELTKISDKLYFRLKVVDQEKGLILGYADKLYLADDDKKNRAAIFPVHKAQIDTNEIWRVSFDAVGDGSPALEINNAIDGISDIAKGDVSFLTFVFPAAIRIVLSRIAEENNFDREGDNWTSKWIVFTQDVLGTHTTPENNEDEDKLKEWYDDVVRSFCVKNKLFDQYLKFLS